MVKSIISSKSYWKSVSYIGLGFMLIYSILEHVMEYKGISIKSFIIDKIDNENWMRFLTSRIVGGLLYGMIMAYYFELRKRKSN